MFLRPNSSRTADTIPIDPFTFNFSFSDTSANAGLLAISSSIKSDVNKNILATLIGDPPGPPKSDGNEDIIPLNAPPQNPSLNFCSYISDISAPSISFGVFLAKSKVPQAYLVCFLISSFIAAFTLSKSFPSAALSWSSVSSAPSLTRLSILS